MIMYLSVLDTESDRDVLQRLYRENRQKLYGIAWKRLQSDADAEDAVHTCFLKMAERFAAYRHQPYENLVRIACITVRNVSVDILRRYRKEVSLTNETVICWGRSDTVPSVLEQYLDRVGQGLVSQALMELSEDERDILNLQYGIGLKPQTIGKMFGITSGEVRKMTHRCRNKLARILEEKGYESK